MTIGDMIPGRKYLVGNGYGYEVIECVGFSLTQEEWDNHCDGPGVYVKVRCDDGREDIYFEAAGHEGNYVYVEDHLGEN